MTIDIHVPSRSKTITLDVEAPDFVVVVLGAGAGVYCVRATATPVTRALVPTQGPPMENGPEKKETTKKRKNKK